MWKGRRVFSTSQLWLRAYYKALLHPFLGWMSLGVDVREPGPEWLRERAGKEWHPGPEAEVNTSLWELPLLLGGDLNALDVVVTSDGGKSPSLLQFLPSFQEVVP